MADRTLTPVARLEREDWTAVHGTGGCSCHLNAPCSSCTHPGNPEAQEQDDAAWVHPVEQEKAS